MKRKSIFVVLALLFAVFGLTACSKGALPKASFKNDEIVVSLKEEAKDFFDEIDTKVDHSKLRFEFSQELFSQNEDGTFKPTNAGQGQVFVCMDDDVLDSAKVIVKSQFSTPSFVSVDREGVISWIDSFAFSPDGERVLAEEYSLIIDEEPAIVIHKGDKIPHDKFDGGVHEITLQAKEMDKKYIDASEPYKQSIDFSVEPIDFTIESSGDFGGQTVTISWPRVSEKLDLTLKLIDKSFTFEFSSGNANKFLTFAEDGLTQSATIDFQDFQPGEIDLILQRSFDQTKLFASDICQLCKLDKPQLEFAAGEFNWSEIDGASKYKLQATKIGQDETMEGEVELLRSNLKGFTPCEYSQVAMQAIGGWKEGVFYLNSDVAFQYDTFEKLSTPLYTYKVNGQSLELTFTEDGNYRVVLPSNITKEFKDVSGGQTKSVNLNEIGLAELEGQVVNFDVYKTPKTEKQILSDEVSNEIFVMKSFGEVKHDLVEGMSKFTFKNVFGGRVDYSVEVNGDSAQRKTFSSEGAEGEETEVEFELDLKKFATHLLDGNKGYNVVITAYLENGYSVNSTVTKSIKILNNVTPLEEQAPGEFAWQAQQHANYQYEIYDVDKAFYEGFDESRYEEPQKSPLNTPTPISETKTQEALASGKYYFIKIVTLSDGTSDEYLSSDFLDGKCFAAVFKYEQQILCPSLTFDTDSLGLTMEIVDHAEEYHIEISLPDASKKELTVYPHGEGTFTHTFSSSDFLNNGKYTISVVARVGASGDGIFTPSKQGQIYVTKLENPVFSVKGDVLTVAEEVEGKAESLEIYHQKSRELLNADGEYSITLGEAEERYQGEFTLEMQYLAVESEGDNYYLNSEKVGYKFSRNVAPTEIDYTTPTLSFVNSEQNDVDHFIVTFDLLSRAFTRNLNLQSVTYQDFVDEWTGENNEFSYIYDQWLQSDEQASLNISVRAYKLGWNETHEKFILPSLDSEKFTLSKLMPPSVTFDTAELKLAWSRLQDGTNYKVYVGSANANQLAGNTTLNEMSLAAQDFSSKQQVWIVAENNKYLLTPKSNVISVKKLNISKQAAISDGKLTLDFSDEKELTDKVVVNDAPDDNIVTSLGRATIDLTRVALPLRLQLRAVADTTSDYYIDSDVSTFNLEDLSNKQFEITYSGKEIKWQEVAAMRDANGRNPLSYILKIWKGEGLVDSIDLTTNSYSLSEEEFTALEEGQYSLTVELVISDYPINAGEIGYFGRPTCEKSGFSKLAKIKSATHSIVEGEGTDDSPDKLKNASVKVVWSDLWSSGVKFEMSFNGKILEGTSGEGYSLTKEEQYTLTLDTSLFNQGENTLIVTPNQDANVKAESFEYIITRYSDIKGLTIDQNGVLTPVSDEISDFALAITPDGMQTQYQRFTGSTFDLLSILDKLESAKGHYSISVVGYDEQAKIVPSQEITASGYRLVIKRVTIEKDGSITIEILNEQESLQDLNFIAKYDETNKDFAPSKSSDTIYTYSMLKFVELFEKTAVDVDFHIDIAVQKENYITSKWSGVEFNYRVADQEATIVRGQYMIDDYVKLVDSEGVQSSVITLESDFVDIAGDNKTFNKTYQGDDATIKGYWIESEKGYSYFSPQLPEGEDSYQECYAIRLASVYESAGAGKYKLRVSRIAYDSASSKYTQYNGKVFDIEKLESVKDETVKLQDDILSWEAVRNVDVSGYYVYIYTKEGEQRNLLRFELVSTASIDSLQQMLSADIDYYIEVVAVSSKVGTLASNPTQEFHAYKYLPPSEVEVVDGNIQLASAKVLASKLATMVASAESDTSLIESISNIRFKDFFTFNISTLAKENPKLKLEFKGQSSQTYTITIRALDLIPDLSATLRRIKTALDNTEQTMASYQRYQDVKLFYETMQKAGGGLANNRILFDDYGEEIPLGVYNVTVVQIGLGEFGTISSNPSKLTELYVAPEPYLSLNPATQKGEYILTFRPIDIKTSGSVSVAAENYVLHLKGKVNYYFYIEKNELNSTYQIARCIVEKDFKTQEYIFTQPIQLEGTEEISIDMKALSKVKIDNASMVIEKAEYKTSVYAVGNNYSASSKSESVTVLYLDINPANITLKQGVLEWSMPKYNTVVSDFNTLVTYEKGSLTARSYTIEFVNGRAKLNLDDTGLSDPDGLYKYISLSIEGLILGNFMAVDSPVYRFNNVFRLYQPQVYVNGNIFDIEAPSQNEGYSEDYKISNNNSGNLWISRREGEYMAGVQGLDDSDELSYKQTEKNATKFYFEGLGQTVENTFVVSESEVEGADFILSIADSPNIVLSSKRFERDAKMLASVSGLQLEDGDLVWTDNKSENDVYSVTVEYYDTGTTMFSEPSVFYTTNMRFNTLFVERKRPNEYYIFKVQKYNLTPSDTESDITTLEGSYFTKDEVINDGVYVLASELVKLGDHTSQIRKTASPTQLQIRRGQISWQAEEGLSSQVVQGDNSIVNGEYSVQDGKTYFVDNDLEFNRNPYTIKVYTFASGNFIKSDLTTATLSGSTRVYKLPLVEREDFQIVSQDVAKGSYQLDLSEFFNSHMIEHQNSVYKVRLWFSGINIAGSSSEGDHEYIDLTRSKTTLPFTIQTIDSVKLKFQVLDATLNTESQTLMLVNGKESEEYDITPTSFTSDDQAGWNDQQKQFEWTYGKHYFLTSTARLYNFEGGEMVDTEQDYGETGTIISLGKDVQNIEDVEYWSINYQEKTYYIESSLVSSAENDSAALFRLIISFTTGQPEDVEVSTKAYKPLRNGIITKVEIYARKDASSLYSLPLVYKPDQNINNMLFAGGDGSAKEPYLISSPEQFANIRFRNEGQKYYFKQTTDLVLSQEHLFGGVFYGEYDGGGKSLTVNFSTLREGSYSLTPIKNQMNFNNYTSLFEEIAPDAAFKNVNLNIYFGSVLQPMSVDANSILAGVAINNYGLISSVNVNSTIISIKASSSTYLAVAGLVGFNYKEISNCLIKSTPSLTATQRIIYAGVALSNTHTTLQSGQDKVAYKGRIYQTFNSGNITVTSAPSNSIVHVCGIAVVNDGAEIVQCGNDGAITVRGSSFTSFVAGIVLRSGSGSEIAYCYNNGTITSDASTKNHAGVCYEVERSSILSLVSTPASLKIIVNSTNPTYNANQNPCYCNEGVGGSFTVLRLSDGIEIDCKDGHTLYIRLEGSVYKAYIE